MCDLQLCCSAVKVTSITNGLRKAGITGGAKDGVSDDSDISDVEI